MWARVANKYDALFLAFGNLKKFFSIKRTVDESSMVCFFIFLKKIFLKEGG